MALECVMNMILSGQFALIIGVKQMSILAHKSLIQSWGAAQITVMRSLVLVLALVATGMLASCSEYEKVNTEVASAERKADAALRKVEPKGKIRQPLKVDSRPWFGSNAVPIMNGKPLPASVMRDDGIVMTFTDAMTLKQVSRQIQRVSGIRTQVLSESQEDDTKFLPANGRRVAGGRMVWSGRLDRFLDDVADTFGADWSYDGRAIQFSQNVTRTFMLHALAAELETRGLVTGGGAGEGGSVPEVNLTASSTLRIWEEIKGAIQTIMGEDGTAAFSPSTGTITVRGKPQAALQVENYLRQQNSMRLRRVSVGVKVLSVETANNYSVGVDMQGILARAFDNAAVDGTFNSADGLNLGVFKNVDRTGAARLAVDDALLANLAASEDIERVSVVHSGAIVTLSDQPAPLQVGRQISYVERVSATTDSGTSIEPGTVDVGLMMTILPRLIQDDRILMRLSVAITDAQQPFTTFESGGSTVQLPEIETTGFLQNAVLNSGETMVLAGFEKNQNGATDRGVPGGIWSGGVRETNRSRNITVLLISSQILPEEPLTVIAQ